MSHSLWLILKHLEQSPHQAHPETRANAAVESGRACIWDHAPNNNHSPSPGPRDAGLNPSGPSWFCGEDAPTQGYSSCQTARHHTDWFVSPRINPSFPLQSAIDALEREALPGFEPLTFHFGVGVLPLLGCKPET